MLLADVGVLVDKKCAKLEHTAMQHEERIGATEDRQRLLEKRQDDLAREHKSLAEQLSIAKKQTFERADVESDNFDRPPNLEIIRITAKKALTTEAVKNSLAPWLNEVVGMDCESWKIVVANQSGKVFFLKFCFLPLQNSRAVNKAMGCIKNEDGSYRKFTAEAADSTVNCIRLDRDENPKSRTQRRMAAVFKGVVANKYPNIDSVNFRRNQKLERTTVYVGEGSGTPLCTFAPKSDTIEASYFLWNYDAVAEFKIDKDKVIEATIEQLDNPDESIEWRV